MSSTPSPALTRWTGPLAGVVVLALLVVFAVLLPKATGGSNAEDPLDLPDTLPGGYTAADRGEAFAGSYEAEEAETLAGRQASARQHSDEVLDEVYDYAAETRTYASEDLTTAVFVQAFRAPGGAFAPETISGEEAAATGAASQELVREGDAICIVQRPAVDPAAGAPQDAAPSYVSCQRSEGDLTVQATASGLPAADLVELLDAAWDAVA
ncbi:hypothetical protein [Nocardioides marmotae]|uniref:hypothetical protein n=1 Tax=Nocardioides marmotae TaxID=2663857 RepID=UPI0012B5F130|nr:hypothetical protein [Nocardioides marmotae]MBC9732989.1 hypothetical protein [Nocardioides marmotae]MTB84103.1 hypothetical protein [Nocardioides marmotae]